MPRFRLRHAFVAVTIALAMLAQGTWALAGTTGGITGTVTDNTTGKPVANARVTAVSPSQSASTTSDAGGHFTLLALAPDTYTVSADKDGYTPVSVAGITVFADQTQTVAIQTQPQLKTIARVTSRAAGALVKPGVTSDTYSVNSTGAQAASALGGGGNLDNAYSAIASVPGVNVPVGGAGWNNNAVFVRGNQSFFTSFEYDGVPVNRAFDNYNSSTESNLGLQELQVYTGGGPAASSSAGTSGFINQVIKTGTFPGFGMLQGGIGTPTFYHSARVEAGGASPNRNFSYYVGVAGTDQTFNVFDNNNGASLTNLGGELDFFPQWTSNLFFTAPPGTTARGDWPICQAGTNVPPAAVGGLPWWTTNPNATPGGAGPCFIYDQAGWLAASAQPAFITDREDVVNLHFGIPHPNGFRDDVQILWSASALNTAYNSSPNDMGGLAAYTLAVTGSPYCPPVQAASAPASCFSSSGAYVPNYPQYIDAPNVYNLPFGTNIQPGGVPLPTTTYFQPSSNPDRSAFAQLPSDLRDTIHNDTGIAKIQYTKSLGANAYARLFGYTFFSDWTQAGANSAFNCYDWGIGGPNNCYVAANYDLITHTGGGELQLVDQISPKHLVNLTSNYTTATVSRFNNTGYIESFFNGGSFVGYVSNSNGVYTCYDPSTGQPVGCRPGSSSPFWNVGGAGPYPTAPAGTPAANAGAQWITLQNGSTYGTLNTVKPKFLFTSLQDDFRPSDRLDINLGVRWDRYEYDLSPLTPGTAFYAQIISQDVCQNAQGQVLTTPLLPGQPPPAPVFYTPDCSVGPNGPITGYHHPNFSATSPSTYILQALSPRLQFTYNLSSNTVLRGEVGRYTAPPITASVQYLNSSGNALTIWNATLPLGFNSPFHPIPLQSAMQSDLSLEHQFPGTQLSVKLSPFFNYTTGYQQQAFIGPNFVTQVPVGAFRSYGVEAALSDGDFNREGLSGQLAFTWTDAKVQYQSKYFGHNQMSEADAAIAQFNTLTKGGGGAPCYDTSTSPPTPISACPTSATPAASIILNPYYNMPQQKLLDPNGWYAPGSTGLSATNNPSTFYFDSPFVTSLILNYKRSHFAITPSLQISEGSAYGGPYDVTGLDPRACAQNSFGAGITGASPSTNPLQCNYLTTTAGNLSPSPVAGQLFIPNPATGAFAQPGQFRNPWLALLNVQVRYDISPKVTALVTLADVWHTCFGGSSEPWTKAYKPNANVCGYYSNASYVSNFFNGTSPGDASANGLPAQTWIQQPYLPAYALSVGSGNPFPFNAFFQLQVKL